MLAWQADAYGAMAADGGGDARVESLRHRGGGTGRHHDSAQALVLPSQVRIRSTGLLQ